MQKNKITRNHALYAVTALFIFFISIFLPLFTKQLPNGPKTDNVLLQILSNTFLYFLAIIGFVFLLATIEPLISKLTRFRLKLKRIEISDRLWTIGLFLLVFGMGCFYSTAFFKHLPHVPDTGAQLINARIFATGNLYLHAHPLGKAFDSMFMIINDKYYSQYPPGHMIFLAVFVLLGAPWLLNPLMGGIASVLVYYVAKEVGNRQIARLSSVMFALSLYVIMMFGEYMNHATAIVCTAGFTLMFIKAHKSRDWKEALLAGLFLGYLFITRPQVALYYSAPYAIFWLYYVIKDWKIYLKPGVVMFMAFLIGVLSYLTYNYATTGDAFVSGYTRLLEQNPRMQKPVDPEYNIKNIYRGINHLTGLHDRLFLWKFSSLIPLTLLFVFKMGRKYSTLLAMPVITTIIGMTFTTYTDIVFYPRYLYETVVGIIPLTAMFFIRLPAYLRRGYKTKIPLGRLRVYITLFLVLTYIVSIPSQGRALVAFSHNYLHGNPGLYNSILNDTQKPALVIYNDFYHHLLVGALFHPPYDNSPVLTIHQKGLAGGKALDRYPDRYIYRLENSHLVFVRPPATQSGMNLPFHNYYTQSPRGHR